MSTIEKLFGRSPFRPLQRHMIQVRQCVAGMKKLLEYVIEGGSDDVSVLAREV